MIINVTVDGEKGTMLASGARAFNVFELSAPTMRMQFVDAAGRPISRTAVTALVINHYNQGDQSTINSRSATDLLDTGGGTYAANLSATAITAANPAVVTAASHGLWTGDRVFVTGVAGMTEINGRTFTIDVLDENRFALRGEDARDHTAYSSGGTIYSGVFEWVMAVGDNPISGSVSTGDRETHITEIGLTVSAIKWHEVATRVLSMEKVA